MGISTSGSFLLIAAGAFIAFGTLYSATANTTERITDAREDRQEHREAIRETTIEVVHASHDGASTLEVRVNNTGERALSVEDTDVVLDGTYVPLSAFETATVDGADTDVWQPGEQLRLVDTDRSTAPDRVKVVTGPGTAATAGVTG